VPNPQSIDIVAAHDFDPSPGSDGEENPAEVPNAFDGDPSTAWTTVTYRTNSHLGNLKPGVGLILDLGEVHTVTDVSVSLDGSPTDLELRAAPESDSDYPTASADAYPVVKTLKGAGSEADFDLSDSPVKTRYLLVWITNLPPVDATHWRAAISEITVSGD
jgi:putative peptidoglycan lipid II flippase